MHRKRKLNRRSFVFTVTGAAVGGATLLTSREARAFQGVTDSDPRDPAGQGRGPAGPPRSGLTDSDPTDRAGQGRGTSTTTPPADTAPRTGVTDSDPTDRSGQGRGPRTPSGSRSGVTDSDPTDPAGNGRGARGAEDSRCANNRARLAELERERREIPYAWSEEQIARARTGLQSIRSYLAVPTPTDEEDRRTRELYYRMVEEISRLYRDLGLPPPPPVISQNDLARHIDRAVAARGRTAEIERQIANHRTNLVALGCR